MSVLHLDFETFSELDLKKVGAHKYAMDPSTEVLCAAWAFDDKDPVVWRPGDAFPERIQDHVLDGGVIEAWNAQFERLIWKYVCKPKHGWLEPHRTQYSCVMVRAMAMALPAMLANAAPAMGLTVVKDLNGSRVMLKLCKPRKPTKTDPRTRWTRKMTPFDYETLEKYCQQDVRVEQACSLLLSKLKKSEEEFYWLDQAINDRGIAVDMKLVDRMQLIVDQQLSKLDAEMREVTDGSVQKCTEATRLVAWLVEGGVRWPEGQYPSIDKDNVTRLLMRDDLTNSQRAAILLRQEAAKTSTAKLNRFRGMVCEDGTIKGSIQFHGASTGRDAARGVQVQNFPRPSPETDVPAAIETIMRGDAGDIEIEHGAPMSIVADCLRSVIIARPDHVLYTRDASQIEARMTSYLSGQDDKVEAFRRFDRKEGPDIYSVSAAGIYNVDVSTIKKDGNPRQVGKVSTLALGFGGGAGAFGSMAKIYKVDLLPLFPIVWGLASVEDREAASDAWRQRGRASGMKKEAWIASELVKIAWRRDNPHNCKYWYNLNDAAVDALLNKGRAYEVRGIVFKAVGSFLTCRLLSGRRLFFAYPKLTKVATPWGKEKWSISYKAVDGMTKRFMTFNLWGGLICQNIVQASARDVLFEAVVRLENAGYPNIMRVHDEAIHETLKGFGSEEEFHRLFVQPPEWAPDFPVAGSGFVATRYRK